MQWDRGFGSVSIFFNERADLKLYRAGDKIFIEKQSFNQEYVSCDINDQCPKDNVCVADGCRILQTKLDVEKLALVSNSRFNEISSNAECAISEDPGQYLCGFTYYLSLHHDTSKSLFVHVPSRQLYSIDDMALALKSIIYEALNQLYGYSI